MKSMTETDSIYCICTEHHEWTVDIQGDKKYSGICTWCSKITPYYEHDQLWFSVKTLQDKEHRINGRYVVKVIYY
jgi:hypothetical protein